MDVPFAPRLLLHQSVRLFTCELGNISEINSRSNSGNIRVIFRFSILTKFTKIRETFSNHIFVIAKCFCRYMFESSQAISIFTVGIIKNFRSESFTKVKFRLLLKLSRIVYQITRFAQTFKTLSYNCGNIDWQGAKPCHAD